MTYFTNSLCFTLRFQINVRVQINIRDGKFERNNKHTGGKVAMKIHLLAQKLSKNTRFLWKKHYFNWEFQKSINIRFQIRAYGWEKCWKLINVRRTFIWNSKVLSFSCNFGQKVYSDFWSHLLPPNVLFVLQTIEFKTKTWLYNRKKNY